MSSYSELIKNFEKIHSYMRKFYVYGFKNREEYDKKSARSYDDERRRMESWLGEYIEQGIIVSEKVGRKLLYRRADDLALQDVSDVLNFYSEVAPCGVIGSFLLDNKDKPADLFGFKHHYITSALDSNVLAMLFTAMSRPWHIKAWMKSLKTLHPRRKSSRTSNPSIISRRQNSLPPVFYSLFLFQAIHTDYI